MIRKKRGVLGAMGRATKTAMAKLASGEAAKEAARLAKRRQVDAFMAKGKAGLQRKKPTSLTPTQIRNQKAAALRKRIMPKTRLDELSEALNQKPRRKK
jgi:hypothetical protein